MKTKSATIACILMMILVGCSTNNATPESTDTNTLDTSSYGVLDASTMFSDFDLDASIDETNGIAIDLNTISEGQTITGVVYTEGQILINKAGTYILSGSFQGSVKVSVGEQDKVQLVLDNATLNATSTASIYNDQSDKLKITLKPGTTNVLTSEGTFVSDGDVNVDGVIFSRDDIVINGTGSLEVTTSSGNGIVGKDDLKVVGATVTVNASGHGLEANDSVRLKEASLTISSGKDGIQADHETDASKGYVYVESTKVAIQSGNDGIQASSVIQLESGDINITTAGGAEMATSAGSDESTKGLKADGIVYIVSGTLEVDAVDDALHSNDTILIDGGTLSIKTGDDGIHADKSIVINEASITILKSYEGIEAADITIESGVISIVSSDDGINASDGTSTSEGGFGGGPGGVGQASDVSITINGGEITILAGGDGIDSNGDLTINGGSIQVSAPVNAADGGLDFDGTATITGGTVIATGSSSMAQNFTTAEQGSILINTTETIAKNTAIVVKDSAGTVIIDTVSQAAYNSIVVSSPLLKTGETVTVILDGTEHTITLSSTVVSEGNSMNGGQMRPGQNPQDSQGRPDQEQGQGPGRNR